MTLLKAFTTQRSRCDVIRYRESKMCVMRGYRVTCEIAHCEPIAHLVDDLRDQQRDDEARLDAMIEDSHETEGLLH